MLMKTDWFFMNQPVFYSHCIRLMHEVVPRVVAIAVRMVMAICRIFCQSSFFMVMSC